MPVSTHSLEKEEVSGSTKKHTKKHISTKHSKTTSHISHDLHLLDAVLRGKLRVIKRLLDSRANPNHCNEHGQTPLMLACTIADEGARRDVVELLLKRGVDTNMQDLQGKSALMSAVQLEDEEMTQCLLDHKCNVMLTDTDGNNALYYASIRGNSVLVRKLLVAFREQGQGAEIDHQNVQGLTPLLGACQEGHLEVARILVCEGGASPTIRDLDHFMTPQEWMKLAGFYSEDKFAFLTPSLQRKSLYRKQRKTKGIRTLTDYLVTNDDPDSSESPNVFALRQNSLEEEHLPVLASSQTASMIGTLSAGKSMFDMPQASKATRTPGYALGHPVPIKPPSHSHSKTAFLTTKSDLYSSNYLSKRKSFLTKNPRSGYFHSGALEPLEGQSSNNGQMETDKSGSHGNKKKHDLLPPIKR